jgi:hypothetical protein
MQIIRRHTVLGSSVPGRRMAEEQQAKCDPNKAIPLHYHPLHEQNQKLHSKLTASSLPPDVDMPSCTGLSPYEQKGHSTEGGEKPAVDNWCSVLKIMMIQKASVVCYKLARAKLDGGQFGMALNMARQGLYCHGKTTVHKLCTSCCVLFFYFVHVVRTCVNCLFLAKLVT